MSAYNPRYLAYCKAMGTPDPEAMLAQDSERWPGGKMAGFMLWVQERWLTWDRLRGHPANHVRCPNEHAAFDLWLGC